MFAGATASKSILKMLGRQAQSLLTSTYHNMLDHDYLTIQIYLVLIPLVHAVIPRHPLHLQVLLDQDQLCLADTGSSPLSDTCNLRLVLTHQQCCS